MRIINDHRCHGCRCRLSTRHSKNFEQAEQQIKRRWCSKCKGNPATRRQYRSRLRHVAQTSSSWFTHAPVKD